MNEALYWRVEVTANGVSYDLSFDLSSFTVEEEDGAPTMLTVQVSDPFAVFSHAFREGMDIEADVGTVDDHRTLFSGRIYHVDGALPLNGTSTLTLKAYDATMRMGLQQRNRRFRDVALSNIVHHRRTAAPRGAANDRTRGRRSDVPGRRAAPSEGNRPRLLATSRAGRSVGRWHLVQRLLAAKSSSSKPSSRFFKGPLPRDAALQPVRREQQGSSRSTRKQTSPTSRCRASSRGMDPTTGETIDPTLTTLTDVGSLDDRLLEDNLAAFEAKHEDRGEALRDLISAAETLDETVRQDLGDSRRDPMPAFATPSQAAQVAQQQPSASLHGMQASGGTNGNKDLHVRKPVDIEGAGRFSGTWFVTKATHMLDRQGYRTDFTCQR